MPAELIELSYAACIHEEIKLQKFPWESLCMVTFSPTALSEITERNQINDNIVVCCVQDPGYVLRVYSTAKAADSTNQIAHAEWETLLRQLNSQMLRDKSKCAAMRRKLHMQPTPTPAELLRKARDSAHRTAQIAKHRAPMLGPQAATVNVEASPTAIADAIAELSEPRTASAPSRPPPASKSDAPRPLLKRPKVIPQSPSDGQHPRKCACKMELSRIACFRVLSRAGKLEPDELKAHQDEGMA